jgi:hypothetical protein
MTIATAVGCTKAAFVSLVTRAYVSIYTFSVIIAVVCAIEQLAPIAVIAFVAMTCKNFVKAFCVVE